MKQTTGKQKLARLATPVAEQETAVDAQGVALTPPVALVDSQPVQRVAVHQPENRTGLPDRLKAGIEQLSGLAMDDVQVHYNSAKPAQLRALAYTHGTDIHVGPGQEKHLPHETWHVVQQKQRRLWPTKATNGIGINENRLLEQEADVMGKKVTQSVDTTFSVGIGNTAPLSKKQVYPVVQRLKSHAEKYARAKELDIIDVKKETVNVYVNDTKNLKEIRRDLLKAWNKNQKKNNIISCPEDLVPKEVEMEDLDDFSTWNSEDEDTIDLPKEINKRKRKSLTLIRLDGTEVSDVPLLEMSDSIRICRQFVKREEYQHLPVVSQIGPLYIEYNNPGTKDIYATPLVSLEEEEEEKFRRAGTSQDYNFQNLTSNLEKEAPDHPTKKKKLDTIFGSFSGGSAGKISEAEAEAIGAISCDFMKGSAAINFVQEAQKRTQKDGFTIYDFFTGTDPYYSPAKKGVRKLVTKRTQERRKKT